jgi:hypothetical protein
LTFSAGEKWENGVHLGEVRVFNSAFKSFVIFKIIRDRETNHFGSDNLFTKFQKRGIQ